MSHNTTKSINARTIQELETEIQRLSVKPKTKITTEKIKQTTNELNQRKQLNKLAAADLEQNNYQYLVFYDSDKGYKKLIGNSALIYAANVAKRVGRRANLREDTDFYAKSESGVISVVLDEKLTMAMREIKIKKDNSLSTEHLHVFKISTPFKKEEIDRFRDVLKKDEREINKMLLPKSPVPTLSIHLNELVEIAYYNTNSMPTYPRGVIGAKILRAADEMLGIYLKLANNKEKPLEAYRKLYHLAIDMKSEMKTVEVLHLMSNRNLCRLLEKIVEVEKLVVKLWQVESKK